MIVCELCEAKNETHRLIEKTKLTFTLIPTSVAKNGHIMILPKRHVTSYADLTGEEAREILGNIEKWDAAFNKNYGESAIVVINRGAHSTQAHLHVHVLPSKGGLKKAFQSSEGITEKLKFTKEDFEKARDELKSSLR